MSDQKVNICVIILVVITTYKIEQAPKAEMKTASAATLVSSKAVKGQMLDRGILNVNRCLGNCDLIYIKLEGNTHKHLSFYDKSCSFRGWHS